MLLLSIKINLTYHVFFTYLYNSFVRLYVTELLLIGWTDFDEIFCLRLSGSLDSLDL